ncbi:MAG: hypothetical protein HQM03_07655 [Magnetococcales bacterium]|nr:hypothetical protein [Magnetococcales bacterium]
MIDYEIIVDMVRQAGNMLREEKLRYESPRICDNSPVIDKDVALFFSETIQKKFTGHHIICEEDIGSHIGSSECAFIIDPNDGSIDYINGNKGYSISVALVERKKFLFGCVYIPEIPDGFGLSGDVMLTWYKDRPSISLNGNEYTDNQSKYRNNILLVGSNISETSLNENKVLFEDMHLIRCASIATRLSLVALGKAAATITLYPLHIWDFAGGQCLLQSASGDLYDEQCNPIRWDEFLFNSYITPKGYIGALDRQTAQKIANQFAPYCKAKHGRMLEITSRRADGSAG